MNSGLTMHIKCTKCNSENIHRSRVRKGERSFSNILLKPLRCRDCKARYWVPSKKAYVVAAIIIFSGLLLMYFIWMSILMPNDRYIVRSPQHDAKKIMIDAATRLHNDHELVLAPENYIDTIVPKRTELISETIATNQKQKLYTDKRNFTVQLYHDRAQKGDTDAQYQLGLLYFSGNGTIQDFEEAVKWFKLAAEKDHALAQYQFGLAYKAGYGVDIDLEKSYMWLNLAAASGVYRATLTRNDVMRSLNPDQLQRAQKTSREWLLNTKEATVVDN